MTVGMATASANTALDTWLTTTFIQLHTGDPGAVGTTAVSSVTTRPSASYNAASGASKGLSASPQWTSWAGTNGEVVTHISFWTASTAGTFKGSCILAASKTVNTGDTLTLSTHTASISPIAA
jgi:hypothetical protein